MNHEERKIKALAFKENLKAIKQDVKTTKEEVAKSKK